jgi:hypothetical protein
MGLSDEDSQDRLLLAILPVLAASMVSKRTIKVLSDIYAASTVDQNFGGGSDEDGIDWRRYSAEVIRPNL